MKTLWLVLLLQVACAGQVGAAPELIEYTTPQGVKIKALYRLPASSEEPFAAVIYHHGRLVSGYNLERSASFGYDVGAFVDQLALDGYAALAPIGDGRIGSEDSSELVEGALGFLKSRPEVDSSHIGIVGFSQGGNLALWAAGNGARCVVLISPKITAEILTKERFEKIHAPVLLLYSREDLSEVVSACEQVLVPTLRSLGIPFELNNGFKVPHKWFMQVRPEYWGQVRGFLDKYLKKW